MSINFIQSSQKDTFGTTIVALCFTTRFVTINSSNDLLRFTILSSIFALVFHIIFYVIRLGIFYLWDKKKDYIGKGKFGYAWDHIEFRSYRQEIIFYYKLTIGLIILIIPDSIFTNVPLLKSPFLFANMYSTELIIPFVYIILFLVVIIDIYLSRPLYKRLCILRVFNALDNWNQSTRQLIREESWEEVYVKMKKIDEKTKLKLKEIEVSIKEKRVNNFLNSYDFTLALFLNNSKHDWRSQINKPINLMNLTFEMEKDNFVPFNEVYLSKKYYKSIFGNKFISFDRKGR